MNLAIRQISYARQSGDDYRPFWRIDFELNGERRFRDVQAQSVIDAKRLLCRDLGIAFKWP
jgi:hypothetical protein